MKKNKINLQHFDIDLTIPQDGANNPAGVVVIEEFISETFVDEILIPGVTVSPVNFAKNGKYIFREIIGGAAAITPLCDTASGSLSSVITHHFEIDKKASAVLKGCYLTNISDIYWDKALWEETKLQIKLAMNTHFKSVLKSNNVPFNNAPVVLDATNTLDEVLRMQEQYRRLNGRPATYIIADFSIETNIKRQAKVLPNNGQLGLIANVDVYQNISFVYADFSAATETNIMYMGRADYNAFGLVNPNETSVLPELHEAPVDGFIVRKSETWSEIERTVGIHLPFGLKILKPNFVMSYPKVTV